MVDHLALAREDLAIAESADAKREAYKRAAEHIAAYLEDSPESTQRFVATKLGRDDYYVNRVLRWRAAGYPPGTTPFTMADPSGSKPTDRAAESHTKRVLRESEPETIERIVRDLPPSRREIIADAALMPPVEPHVPRVHPTDQGWLPSKLLGDAVMRAFRAWSKMQDDTPPNDVIRERCLADAELLARYADGIAKLLRTGDIDAELAALLPDGVSDDR